MYQSTLNAAGTIIGTGVYTAISTSVCAVGGTAGKAGRLSPVRCVGWDVSLCVCCAALCAFLFAGFVTYLYGRSVTDLVAAHSNAFCNGDLLRVRTRNVRTAMFATVLTALELMAATAATALGLGKQLESMLPVGYGRACLSCVCGAAATVACDAVGARAWALRVALCALTIETTGRVLDACAVGELHAFTLATLVVVWWMACDFDVSRRIRAFAAAVEIAGAGTLLAALACYVYLNGASAAMSQFSGTASNWSVRSFMDVALQATFAFGGLSAAVPDLAEARVTLSKSHLRRVLPRAVVLVTALYASNTVATAVLSSQVRRCRGAVLQECCVQYVLFVQCAGGEMTVPALAASVFSPAVEPVLHTALGIVAVFSILNTTSGAFEGAASEATGLLRAFCKDETKHQAAREWGVTSCVAVVVAGVVMLVVDLAPLMQSVALFSLMLYCMVHCAARAWISLAITAFVLFAAVAVGSHWLCLGVAAVAYACVARVFE